MEIRGNVKLVEEIVDWAAADDTIRAVMITSSTVNPNAPFDALSDYDIRLFVTDPRALLDDEAWMTQFGEVLIVFRDKHIRDGLEGYARLVQYEDTTKIDFIIDPVAMLTRIATSPALPDDLEIGYRMLVDKDGLSEGLKEPSFRAYIPPRPPEQEYQDVVNEFWWDATYVAKHLWRDQILPANWSFDMVMCFSCLVKMLDWTLQIGRDWDLNPGKLGGGAKKYLPEREWAELASTFAGSGIEENWAALFNMTAFFRRIAIAVANDLRYRYPLVLDERVSVYLAQVRSLDQ